MKCPRSVMILGLASLGLLAVPVGHAQQGAWSRADELPRPRVGLAGASLDGKVYAIGGMSLLAPVQDVEVFDPNSGSWREQTPLPEGRTRFGAAVLGGRIYVAGGTSAKQAALDDVLVLTGEGGPMERWDSAANLPGPRAGHAVVSAGGKLYALGGSAPGLDVYEPSSDTWSRQDAPEEIARFAAAAVGTPDAVYFIGGERNGETTARVDIYDVNSQSWRRGPDLPSPRRGMAAIANGDVIHVFGGGEVAGGDVSDSHYVLKDGAWSTLAPLPSPRADFAIGLSNGDVVVFGGGVGSGYLAPFTTLAAVDVFHTEPK